MLHGTCVREEAGGRNSFFSGKVAAAGNEGQLVSVWHCNVVVRRSFSWTTTVHHFRTKQARTDRAGARHMQVL